MIMDSGRDPSGQQPTNHIWVEVSSHKVSSLPETHQTWSVFISSTPVNGRAGTPMFSQWESLDDTVSYKHWILPGVQGGTDRKRFLRAAGLEGSPKTVQSHCLQIAVESRCGSFQPNPAELLDGNLCDINRRFTRFQVLYVRRNATNLDWKGRRE